MSESSNLSRGTFFAIAGVTSLTLLFYAYKQYENSYEDPIPKPELHRSNAVRRQRRWRRGVTPQSLDYNPTERALQSLSEHENTSQGYGFYTNRFVLESNAVSVAEEEDMKLLPNNVDAIYTRIFQHCNLTNFEKDQLRFHIHALFVQNFLHAEYPLGYIIGNDVQQLTAVLCPRIDQNILEKFVRIFDQGGPLMPANLEFQPDPDAAQSAMQTQSEADHNPELLDDLTHALGGRSDNESSSGLRSPRRGQTDDESGQNVLEILYRIGEEQAKRSGYIHRGVQCNGCGMQPIEGIRYHCANCWDYDLCEACEAQQIHMKSHVFYKIRIPAPTRGQIKRVQPKWYPGNPNACPDSVPKEVQKYLVQQTELDRQDLDALYDQFRCIAGRPLPEDPSGIGMAIDRTGFDYYFTTTGQDRAPPQNLLYDRIFAFYDKDSDGLINFEEFARGMMELTYHTSRYACQRRLFDAFDLDDDSYIDRKDFLRMLRAHYALSKDLTYEMIYARDDAALAEEEVREAINGSHPISAAFGGSIFPTHMSRPGQDKVADHHGDLRTISETNGVVQDDTDMLGDRLRAIENAAVGNRPRAHPFRSFRQDAPADEPVMVPPSYSTFNTAVQHADDATEEDLRGPDPSLQVYGWPPLLPPEEDDIMNALGTHVPLDDIMDPVDRTRVVYAQAERLDQESDQLLNSLRKGAINERWRRRQFYTDQEEGMSKPPGYTEADSSDDDNEPDNLDQIPTSIKSKADSRRQSLRSRSSSKVRFDDSAIDTDYETRSDISSRSIPLNERWGGVELSGPERDIGRDIIYQAVQQGFNEMLDGLFKKKEDAAMEAISTQSSRERWAAELDAFQRAREKAAENKDEALRQADMIRTEELLATSTAATKSNSQAAESDPDDPIGIMFGSLIDEKVEERPDPTLPQNRPNDASVVAVADKEDVVDEEAGLPPSPKMLELWLSHRAVDAEASARGGYGRLDFHEFQQAMSNEIDSESQEDGPAERESWATSAGLGKLSFLSAWLDMAQF